MFFHASVLDAACLNGFEQPYCLFTWDVNGDVGGSFENQTWRFTTPFDGGIIEPPLSNRRTLTLSIDTQVCVPDHLDPLPGVIPCPEGLRLATTYYNQYDADFPEGAFTNGVGKASVYEAPGRDPSVSVRANLLRATPGDPSSDDYPNYTLGLTNPRFFLMGNVVHIPPEHESTRYYVLALSVYSGAGNGASPYRINKIIDDVEFLKVAHLVQLLLLRPMSMCDTQYMPTHYIKPL